MLGEKNNRSKKSPYPSFYSILRVFINWTKTCSESYKINNIRVSFTFLYFTFLKSCSMANVKKTISCFIAFANIFKNTLHISSKNQSLFSCLARSNHRKTFRSQTYILWLGHGWTNNNTMVEKMKRQCWWECHSFKLQSVRNVQVGSVIFALPRNYCQIFQISSYYLI